MTQCVYIIVFTVEIFRAGSEVTDFVLSDISQTGPRSLVVTSISISAGPDAIAE